MINEDVGDQPDHVFVRAFHRKGDPAATPVSNVTGTARAVANYRSGATMPLKKYTTTRAGWREGRPRRSTELGAAAVELAMVLPLFLALVLGILTGGIAMDHKIGVTNAAREAARYGAIVPASQCADTTKCGGRNWAQLVQAVAGDRLSGEVPASQICVALVSGSGSSPVPVDGTHTTRSDGSACYNDSSNDTGQRVQVTMTRTDRMQVFFWAKDLALSARVVARFEQ